MPESAYGPTNNCVGIGEILLRRGHRVVFAAEASWAGKLEAAGLRRGPGRPAPPPEPADGDGGACDEADAGAFWKEFIRDTAPEFRKPTIEQLATFMQPTWQALIDGARYCEPQLREIIARAPARRDRRGQRRRVPRADDGRACRSCGSCRATRWRSRGRTSRRRTRGCPPATASQWAAFRAEYDRTHRATWTEFDAWCREQGAAAAARRWSSCTTSRPREPLRLPAGRSTTPTRARSARPGTGSTPSVRDHRPSRRSAAAAHRPSRRQRAGLPLARLARVGRRRAHAAARRRCWPTTPHRYIVSQGSAGRRVRPGAEHVGRRVPAADHAAAAGRPGHHARRQQHDDRGVPPRQADGRAAAVLGPVRQRPAGRTRPGSASGWRRTPSRTPS